MKNLQQNCPGMQQLDDGRLFESRSGFLMQFFKNDATKTITLAFGGTTAGELQPRGGQLSFLRGVRVAAIGNGSYLRQWNVKS